MIPVSAKPATVVTVQAKDTGSSDAASGSYSVSSLPQLQPKLTVVSGDQQTGLPGKFAGLAPLVAVLRDINGNPLPWDSGGIFDLAGSQRAGAAGYRC